MIGGEVELIVGGGERRDLDLGRHHLAQRSSRPRRM